MDQIKANGSITPRVMNFPVMETAVLVQDDLYTTFEMFSDLTLKQFTITPNKINAGKKKKSNP